MFACLKINSFNNYWKAIITRVRQVRVQNVFKVYKNLGNWKNDEI